MDCTCTEDSQARRNQRTVVTAVNACHSFQECLSNVFRQCVKVQPSFKFYWLFKKLGICESPTMGSNSPRADGCDFMRSDNIKQLCGTDNRTERELRPINYSFPILFDECINAFSVGTGMDGN